MAPTSKSCGQGETAVVIGAGIAGLSAAARLAQSGVRVTVVERHRAPGGKMRTLPSAAGPVDAGPTVLTLRPVIEELFTTVGERLDDHLLLRRLPLLARHFWPDGSVLDLYDTAEANDEAIRAFAGARAARQFHAFSDRARALFDGFDAPMMRAPEPSLARLASHCVTRPSLLRHMAAVSTLARSLENTFDDPRLAQLFGRYATYVGGSPYGAPSLLALIWQAEYAGVWSVAGGMHRLAEAIVRICDARGVTFRYSAHVARIDVDRGRATGITLEDGTQIKADTVLFNGDPRALATGALGPDVERVAARTRTEPRSLSADVWAFAATARGPDLAYHNVFFRAEPKPEFDALAKGERVPDPTIYLCAMDRAGKAAPPRRERFEIIANAPPLPAHCPETSRCHVRTFQTLERFGLTFDPSPDARALTTPDGYEALFPASLGSLYGQSPHGLLAAFKRPTARTAIPGLYLAGGGTHPGAGVPMAMLSAQHAVAAILSDRTSIYPSRRTATRGGMSTA